MPVRIAMPAPEEKGVGFFNFKKKDVLCFG